MTITTTATTATRLMDMQLDACTPAGPAWTLLSHLVVVVLVLVVVVAVPKRESHQKRFTASTVASCTRGLVVDMGVVSHLVVVVLVLVVVVAVPKRESHQKRFTASTVASCTRGLVVDMGVVVDIVRCRSRVGGCCCCPEKRVTPEAVHS
jgi:uncharacterized membrane protein